MTATFRVAALAALMAIVNVILVLMSDWFFILLLLLPLSNTMLGALAARRGSLQWPDLVRAALLASPAPLVAMGRGSGGELIRALFEAALCVSGMFLLPLADPLVRRQQGVRTSWPAPAGAVALLLSTVLPFAMRGGREWFGFGMLVAGGLGGLALAGVASLLVLVGGRVPGLWIGGVGALLALLSVLVWVVTGAPHP